MKGRWLPAVLTSVGIHGVLVVLVVAAGIAGHRSDARDQAGVIGSADRGSGSGAGGAISPPPAGPSLSEIEGARYVGRYLRAATTPANAEIEVGLINDGEVEPHWTLMLREGYLPVQKLVPVTRDTFAFQLAPRQRVVFRRVGDSVTAISVRRGRDTTWAERAVPEHRPD